MESIDVGKRERKQHRASRSGVKARKKDATDKKRRGLSSERHNPKAFSVANVVRTKRMQQRNMDRAQQKEVVPLVNRAEEDLTPPVCVVVMGPPRCGKSTLIRSLVKIFSNQNLVDVLGPITVVAGKNKRLTFIECPQDIHAMTDLAKVADLVLLMVDGSYGFEMETFEFLNVLQLHGFPKVLGIVTHLDKFKLNKSLQNTKKTLKHRFWTEIYKGAKMFDFTGVVNGKYLKHEVKRLMLHLSRIKFRPLVWRNTHPYVVVDRVEDVTSGAALRQDPLCDRDVVLMGYVRGTHLKPSMRVHLMGVGDFDMVSVQALSDPCPATKQPGAAGERSLKLNKEALLYAPMANVGRVRMDRDGTYIELHDIHYTKPEYLDVAGQSSSSSSSSSMQQQQEGTPAALLRNMQDLDAGVDAKLRNAELSLFSGSKGVKSSDVIASNATADEDAEDDDDDSVSDDDDDEEEEDEEEDDEEDGGDAWSESGEEGSEGDMSEDSPNGEEWSDDDYEGDDGEEEGVSDDEPPRPGRGAEEAKELGSVMWKMDMKEKAANAFQSRNSSSSAGSNPLMQSIYGPNWMLLANDGAQTDWSTILHAAASEGDKQRPAKGAGKSRSQEHRSSAPGLWDEEEGEGETEGLFQSDNIGKGGVYAHNNASDSHRATLEPTSHGWTETDLLALVKRIRNKFVTGDWTKANQIAGQNDQSQDDASVGSEGSVDGDGDSIYGDFEDLQTGQVFKGRSQSASSGSEEDEGVDRDSDGDDDDDEGEPSDDDSEDNNAIDERLRQMNAAKKAASRLQSSSAEEKGGADAKGGDGSDDDEERALERRIEKEQQRLKEQRDRNREEFGDAGDQIRITHEGLRQGKYVRILLKNVPAEFCRGFNPALPVVLGGLQPHESDLGIIHARVKRHRWHKRVLKCNDPLIFSVGWRRYQSIPVYSMEEDISAGGNSGDRKRYLKYTPEHMHCMCSFYGPLVPVNTGILAYQRPDRGTSGFRISLTGTALEMSSTVSVVKKLKLVGTPSKVFKNTAFIKGMFNSALEVAKLEGAKLKTVSGIRGSIKKAIRGGGEAPGSFRATFEDKILMSDIVFCRAWVPVEIKKFYNPVTSLLPSLPAPRDDGTTDSQSPAETPSWIGMRPIAQIRKSNQVPIPTNKDSVYKPITRAPKTFSKLSIPKKLQETLPFSAKPKQMKEKNRESYLSRRAVVVDPEDRDRRAAVQIISTIKSSKLEKRRASDRNRSERNAIEKEREAAKFQSVHKEERKRRYVTEGKTDAKRAMKKQRT